MLSKVSGSSLRTRSRGKVGNRDTKIDKNESRKERVTTKQSEIDLIVVC